MKNKDLIIFWGIIVILIIIILFSISGNNKYDEFAQCLTDNNVKMYGAYWCPHCANQKSLFGDSFNYINYIECSLPERAGQTEICIKEDIKVYPTWEFAEGTRKEGVLTLEQLSELGSCELR